MPSADKPFLRCAALIACVIGSSAPALRLSSDDDLARETALQWLHVLDSGNFQDAASMMTEQVRASRDWSNHLMMYRAPYGRVRNRHLVKLKHASTIPGAAEVRNYDIIRFKTSFERPPSSNYPAARKAVATEEVVMARMGCCWEIFGYKIDN